MADPTSLAMPKSLNVKGGDAMSGARSWGGASDGQMFSPFIVNQGGGLWWAVAAVILGYFLWKRA